MKHILFLIIFSLLFIRESHAQDPVGNYQQFMTAYAEKKYEDCARLDLPLAEATNHPGIQYKLAEAYCQTNQFAQSLDILALLAKRGLTYRVESNTGFSPLYGDKRFVEYSKAFAKNRTVLNKSGLSFVVNDSLLIPEGIAYDSQQQAFFLASLAKHKVIRCSGNGNCSDFAVGKESGFWAALGMKVSPDFKTLWVCSAAENDTLNGYSGIFQFEIPSGKLIRKFVLDNKNGPHLFNDLAITGGDNIYFTDSKAGKVWWIRPGTDTLTEYAAGFIYPNGIAADEKNKTIFIADFIGLHMIDLVTGKRTRLDHQQKTYLNGIDGIYYYKGSLIGIQDSGNQDDRVVRFSYDTKTGTITNTETLQTFRKDFIIPTTGTIVDGELHYIANSQLRNLQPDGTLTDASKLVKPVILKLKLD